ncbi:hypothetical protein [Streptomyces sp. Z26]|uniref:hypothetical protein n=1 Tax=Streptomyces sp. Z26 TaxID=2500177 RepID=UPI000EF1721E|nr:hypothetical protein [Streptomyces sp. Z26]RLL66220.1 hypothetical protein D7M15_04205 [Streptomyces sp. Z26]
MRAAAFLYPWDVVGDPDAPRRLADLGVRQVTLASAYHSTRALTPRHPRTRVVTARHSAVLYPADPARWDGRALRPYAQEWMDTRDPFGDAARALTGAGLEVHSWVVLAHNSRLGEEHPHTSVRNAYGDRYPWAPCVARSDVRAYAAALAAEAAVRPGARGTELESCGWYGLAHLHAHDKIGGMPPGPVTEQLMSLCFCAACRSGYAEGDADPDDLADAVRRALAPLWHGAPEPRADTAAGEWAAVAELLGAERASAVAAWRDGAASRFQRETVAAVRASARAEGATRFRVLLHAQPGAHKCGANAGTRPDDVLAHADGVVVPCAGGAEARTAVLAPYARAVAARARRADGTVRREGGTGVNDGRTDGVLGADGTHGTGTDAVTVAANLPVVAGMGGSPHTLAEDAAHARALGAHELRLYHAGLASDRDLVRVRDALSRIG